MITPLDIENKKFSRKLMGYREDEVEDFLERIIDDYEKLYRENIELKDRINSLNESIQHYKSIEETLQNALVIAQSTGEDIKRNAYISAENIIKDADLKSTQLIDAANREVVKIKTEYEELKKAYNIFKAKFESTLMTQLEIIKNMDSD